MLETVKTIVARGLISSMIATLIVALIGGVPNLPMYFVMIGCATAIHAGFWLWEHKYKA